MLEAVRISCAGFPCKTRFENFTEHFRPLAPHLYTAGADDRDITAGILKLADLQGAQLGKSKVGGQRD